jgi:histidine triad (HIT) family protein
MSLIINIFNIKKMTLFEKIIAREIPANIEYEDNDIIVIHDINPKAKIHLLIIPKKPITTVANINIDISNENNDILLMGKLFAIAKKMGEKLYLEGYKLQCNVGEKGGQEIFHIHLHLLSN